MLIDTLIRKFGAKQEARRIEATASAGIYQADEAKRVDVPVTQFIQAFAQSAFGKKLDQQTLFTIASDVGPSISVGETTVAEASKVMRKYFDIPGSRLEREASAGIRSVGMPAELARRDDSVQVFSKPTPMIFASAADDELRERANWKHGMRPQHEAARAMGCNVVAKVEHKVAPVAHAAIVTASAPIDFGDVTAADIAKASAGASRKAYACGNHEHDPGRILNSPVQDLDFCRDCVFIWRDHGVFASGGKCYACKHGAAGCDGNDNYTPHHSVGKTVALPGQGNIGTPNKPNTGADQTVNTASASVTLTASQVAMPWTRG